MDLSECTMEVNILYYLVRKNTIPFITGLSCGITFVISHNFARIKADSFDSFPLEETLTLHNLIILIKSVLTPIYSYHLAKKYWHKSFLIV